MRRLRPRPKDGTRGPSGSRGARAPPQTNEENLNTHASFAPAIGYRWRYGGTAANSLPPQTECEHDSAGNSLSQHARETGCATTRITEQCQRGCRGRTAASRRPTARYPIRRARGQTRFKRQRPFSIRKRPRDDKSRVESSSFIDEQVAAGRRPLRCSDPIARMRAR